MSMSTSSPPDTLVSRCPACGKPRPVHGATTVRCDACGHEHPVEPALLRAAEIYRVSRKNVPLRLQQTGDIEALASKARATLNRFRVAAALLGAPLFVLFVVGLHHATLWRSEMDRPRTLYAPSMILPALVLTVAAALTWRRMASLRREIESLLWARPLADVPGQLGCRMCGGPLGVHPARGSVTCAYCRADNVVPPEASRLAAKLALLDYGEHARRVLARVEKGGGRALAVFTFVGPLAALVVSFGAAHTTIPRLVAKRLPPNLEIAYVEAACPSEATRRSFVQKVGEPWTHYCLPDGEKPTTKPFALDRLRGAQGLLCDGAFPSGGKSVAGAGYFPVKYVDVFSDGFGRNKVVVDTGFLPHGSCFVHDLVLEH